MSFVESVLFGQEGSYRVLGIDVCFFENKKMDILSNFRESTTGIFSRTAGYLADCCLKSRTFRVLTQGYAHTFIHEMGHAAAYKVFGHDVDVRIFTNQCSGMVNMKQPKKLFCRESMIISLAGPMLNMAFSGCKLAAAITLRSYITTPVALTIGASAIIWMTGELFVAYISANNKYRGDFGIISNYGKAPLAIAGTALAAQYALQLFLAIQLY